MTVRKLKSASGADCNIAGLAPLAELSTDIQLRLQGMCRVRAFRADEVVQAAEERSDFVGFVRDGVLRMQKYHHDGRRHIVGLLVEGDVFGRVFDHSESFSIEAATDGEVLTFQRGPFEALLAESPELDRVVMLNFLNELDRARDWLVILAHPKIRGLLAGFLLMIVSRFARVDHFLGTASARLRIRIPISRSDLSDLLGTRPESISRVFHALADDGVFTIERPDLVSLIRVDALADEAGAYHVDDNVSVKDLIRNARRISV